MLEYIEDRDPDDEDNFDEPNSFVREPRNPKLPPPLSATEYIKIDFDISATEADLFLVGAVS